MTTDRRALLLTVLLVITSVACVSLPKKVTMNDPRIKPLLTAAASFPRTHYGFTPLPAEAAVRWESRPTTTYDAMLHISSKTYRTIAFRRDGAGYRWIGEQETFRGPREYETPDGNFKEEIVLTYESEHVSGAPLNQLFIQYHGDDPRLAWPHTLELPQAQTVLREWGYNER